MVARAVSAEEFGEDARCVDEILRTASAFFAAAELDRRWLPTSAPDSRFLYINHARTDSSDESSTTDSYAGAHVKMSDYFFAHAPGRAPQISDIAKWFHHVVASENANT